MSTKVESANLLIKLYDLRREEVMRQARTWFVGFNPESAQEIASLTGENSAYYRMVTTYWDMACSFVNQGAIDEEMFNEANGEHVLVFAKVEPFLAELRSMFGSRIMPNIEKLVRRMPDADARLTRTRDMLKQLAARRAAEDAKAQTEQ
ncbi:MAG TPA: hypothetical protein VF666_13255 [Pyrinomonadaceae bacterium]|jgi:hypothetical protein